MFDAPRAEPYDGTIQKLRDDTENIRTNQIELHKLIKELYDMMMPRAPLERIEEEEKTAPPCATCWDCSSRRPLGGRVRR